MPSPWPRIITVQSLLALCSLAGALFVPELSAQTPQTLALSPGAISFGDVLIGVSSQPQIIVVASSAFNSISIGDITTSGDFTQTNNCQINVTSYCLVFVSFAPTATGLLSGSVSIPNNSSGSTQIVSLNGVGRGPAPIASLSSTNLIFMDQSLGGQSVTARIQLQNTGSSPLLISGIWSTGDFNQNNSCGPKLATGASCYIYVTFSPSDLGPRNGLLMIATNATDSPQAVPLQGNGMLPTSGVTAVWANEGGDKVTQDELRVSEHVENKTGTVINSAWNGTTITLSGAHNEVVAFDLVLESANGGTNNVAVQFDTLTGPGGATIASSKASSDGVFNWVGRPIELFYVRYLQITGLSYFGYGKGDERQIPLRFQTPWTGNGTGTGFWIDRPDHAKFYPDIMVPLELNPTFNIAQGQNQSIWSDIYIPKSVPSGTYSGNVSVYEDGNLTHTVPVQLSVANFGLPDAPTTKTMVNLDTIDIGWRFVTGFGGYANWLTPGGQTIKQITDEYYELFHRHKISLVGENECPASDHPCDSSRPRLDGSLFTASSGYDGPGVNTPNGVYSIGTYGIWGDPLFNVPGWKFDRGLFTSHIDNWVSWFDANAPLTDYFLYLEDEPPASDYAQVETWAEWIANDPGPGQRLRSLATVDAGIARTSIPSLDIPMTRASLGACANGATPCDVPAVTQDTANFYNTAPGRKYWIYNDGRPAVGSFATEDDGVSPRTFGWAQYKKGIDRWFYWYANLNSNVDWFASAATWGSDQYFDNSIGWTSSNGKSNGDGVIVYPGTDLNHPADSYGVKGPFASLRLKQWRRGIQDADYLAIANQIDPASTQNILKTVMPAALWDYPTTDPSYYSGGVSWSANPDVWEAGRYQLIQIISHWCNVNPGNGFCSWN